MKKILVLVGLIFVALLVFMIFRFFYLRVANSPDTIPGVKTQEEIKKEGSASGASETKTLLQKETKAKKDIVKEDKKVKDFLPYIPLFFDSGLEYLTVSTLTGNVQFGTVLTPRGPEKTGALAGYETVYCHKDRGCLVRVKTEKMNPDTFLEDKVKFFYSLVALVNASKKEVVKKEWYNGLECDYMESGDLDVDDSLLSRAVIYLPRDKVIVTVSFDGELASNKKFRDWEEFVDFRVKFLEDLTDYYVNEGNKEGMIPKPVD